MTEHRTGPRWDGRMWPGPGGEIDVDPEEGAAVVGAGWAVPVTTEQRAETPEDTLAASEETRDGEPSSPAVNDPKANWVTHAISQGAAPADAEAMTKQALIEHYGG